MGRGAPRAALALAAFALCARCLAHPLPDAPNYDAPPPLELAALGPAALAALTLVTLVVFLAGCVCCKRNKFTPNGNDESQFTDAVGDLPEMMSSSLTAAPAQDTGIVNPIADREFTIFGPLSPENRPVAANISPEHHPRIAQIQFYGPAAVAALDDDGDEDDDGNNNNGPISPQELENIENNNAENYIVSEYENRNLNREPVVNGDEPPQASHYREEQMEWFENPTSYFPRSQLQYLQEIGKGWFGRIVEADAHNLGIAQSDTSNPNMRSNTNAITTVAVKILDENVSAREKCVFLDECKLYKNANDKNVLKLLSYNLSQDPWLVIFEYCSMGDLKTFLKSNISSMASLNDKGIPLKFQCEVASALSYLHSQNFVLPDIACHSCLVTENLNIKVGDYGGAVLQHPSDFYYVFDKPLPIRWLAPETWMQNSTKYSNMWSFGIFLWESSCWGNLPYENLSNDQIISSVLVQNGIRLTQPSSSSVFASYLYQIMQSCWQENPSDRINAVEALALLGYIFSNCFESDGSEQKQQDPWTRNFEQRWQNLKPNTIPKVDNAKNAYDESSSKFDAESICPAPSEGSSDVHLDDFSEKTKSDSLTNLHGSLESIQDRNATESDKNSNKESEVSFASSLLRTPLRNNVASLCSNNCEVAPWLQDLPVTSQEDMSYIKTVSDVISDLDNMLSSEKTSSSESSHQTSPSRDITNNTISSNKNISIDTLYNVRQDLLDKNVSSDNNANVHSESRPVKEGDVNIAEKAFQFNDEKQNKNESYPTLDFRLDKLDNSSQDVHPIFKTKCNMNSSQDFDSLQDTSYIPSNLKSIESDGRRPYTRQYSSGSETEDEMWKKQIEIGAIAEKIKLKSKSVTDFMVLTHIDMDFTDLESGETSITSVDGKTVPVSLDRHKRRLRHDSPSKDCSLPVGEYGSFQRNFSFVNSFRNDHSFFTKLDVKKIKKNMWNLTLRSLRPIKSLNDLNTLGNKAPNPDELVDFKRTYDSFLDRQSKSREDASKSDSKNYRDNASVKSYNDTDSLNKTNASLNSTDYFKLPEMNFANPAHRDNATSTPKDEPDILPESAKPITIEQNIDQIERVSVDETKFKTPVNEENGQSYPDSSVLLGPFSDCTLDLYTGLKTDFKDHHHSTVPEEEALMFSSNFNNADFRHSNESNGMNSPIPNAYSDVSSAYFFNSAAVNRPVRETEKDLNYSIDTWDRFLGSSFEANSPPNYDSIFPDANEIDKNSNVSNGVPAVVGGNEQPLPSFPPDYEASQNDFNNLTSKLAIAENENNLNLELSIPPELFPVGSPNPSPSHGNHDSSSPLDNNVGNETFTIEGASKEDSNELPSQGWFLHEKGDAFEEPESDSSLDTFDKNNASLLKNCEKTDNKPNRRKNVNPSVDAESVEALRTELELKLPLAQMINQCMQDVNTGQPESTANEYCSSEQSSEQCQNKTNEPTCSDAETQVARNEVLIHYKIPLSPIQEESWSEFSEMVKMVEFDKSDTSNSLSLGQLNSMVVEELNLAPSNLVNEQIDDKVKLCSDDEGNDDSHDSNRTFVILEGNEKAKINGRLSTSADSLNSIEDQIDMDCEPDAINLHSETVVVQNYPTSSHATSELLSPFCEEPSTTKSNEEISLNVDNLLENISKTLDDASKVGLVNKDLIASLDSIAENPSDVSLSDADSRTYVIDAKNPIANDVTYTCPKRVIEVPEDLSNVSKISQPSLISDTTVSESTLKPSRNLHTKTPSIDSWCSNDTLYNIEENFDDNLSLNEFSEEPEWNRKGNRTPTNGDYQFAEATTCSQAVAASTEKHLAKLPSIEAVMNYPSRIEDVPEDIMIPNIRNDMFYNSNHDSPLKFSPLDIACTSEDSNCSDSNNKSSDNLVLATDATVSDQIDTVIKRENCSNDNGNGAAEILNHTPKPEAAASSSKVISATSTPVCNSDKQASGLQFKATQESISSAQNLVDAQFNFLNDIAAPNLSADEQSDENASRDGKTDAIVNFVSVEQKPEVVDFVKIEKTFLESENLEISKKFDSLDSSKLNSHFTKIDDVSPIVFENSCSDTESINSMSKRMGDDATSNKLLDDSGNLLKVQSSRLEDISPILFDSSSTSSESANLSKDKSEGFVSNKPLHEPDNLSKSLKVDDISSIAFDNCTTGSESTHHSSENPKKTNDSKECIINASSTDQTDSMNKNSDVSCDSLTYADFHKSAELRIQETDGKEVMSDNSMTPYNPNLESSNHSQTMYDNCDSNLSEYLAYSGLNLNSLNATSDKNSDASNLSNMGILNASNLLRPDFNSIQFSGPVNESLFSSSNSYERDIKNIDDVNNLPPECLKDWDSGSDESNGNSSSSGEFTWKKGDSEEPIKLSTSIHLSPDTTRNKKSLPGSSYNVIIEEPNDSDSSNCSSDEEIEFTPSIWNCSATPGKSSLKSADGANNEKKKVVFKKQKHICFYEYPREASDHESESPNLYYSDWQDLCNNDAQFLNYGDLCSSEVDGVYSSSDHPETGEDFYVPTASFEPYNYLNSSSQFFPGQHLSLLDHSKSYEGNEDYEIDDEPLPPLPTELIHQEDDPSVVQTVTDTADQLKSSDFITPDSGTEDVTPGSLLDYEISSKPSKEGGESLVIPTNHELLLNMTNKNRSNKNCNALILPDKSSSPSDTITPGTPSPSGSQSSGSTSPLTPLGGLRHTRDKLKLDLPPSPLARNSPGKSFNPEAKVFDFKHVDSLESHAKSVVVVQKIEGTHAGKAQEAESPDSMGSTEKLDDDSKIDDKFESATLLQKAVVPIHIGDHTKKSILEPVKGEGTLLDSGDEDSGIGNSAYTTLERKIEGDAKAESGER